MDDECLIRGATALLQLLQCRVGHNGRMRRQLLGSTQQSLLASSSSFHLHLHPTDAAAAAVDTVNNSERNEIPAKRATVTGFCRVLNAKHKQLLGIAAECRSAGHLSTILLTWRLINTRR